MRFYSFAGGVMLMIAAFGSPASADPSSDPKCALLTSAEVEAAVVATVGKTQEADRSAASLVVSAGVFRGQVLDSLQNPWLIDERDLTRILVSAGMDQSDEVRMAIKRLLDEHYAINLVGAIRKAALLANDRLPPLPDDQAKEIAMALVITKYSPVAGSLKVVGNAEHKGLHPVLLYGKGQNGVFRYFGVMLNHRGDVLHDDGSDFPDLIRWGRIPNEYELERL